MAKVTYLPLTIRKLADRSVGERVKRFDPETGQGYLADPATWDRSDESTWVENPWPTLGIAIEGDAPKHAKIPTSFVDRGLAEGWLSAQSPTAVHRPGGPPEQPWRVTHTFLHAQKLTLHTVDGDVHYRVVDQPDKWPAEKNDRDEGFGGDVRWYYVVELEA